MAARVAARDRIQGQARGDAEGAAAVGADFISLWPIQAHRDPPIAVEE